MITPTSVGGMAGLSPIELSSATGTNSVVLKMRAQCASASTPYHECFAATESRENMARAGWRAAGKMEQSTLYVATENVPGKKKPARWRAESISGGDMEETK